MGWYKQLDKGKETGVTRFFTDNQVKALDEIQKKTKRVCWMKTSEPKQKVEVVAKLDKPTKTITLVDIDNATTVDELEVLINQTENPNIKRAIKEKIKSLTN